VGIHPSGSAAFTPSAFLTYNPGELLKTPPNGMWQVGSGVTFPCDYRYEDCDPGNGDSNRVTMSPVMSSGAGETVSISVFVTTPISPAPNNQFQVAIYSDNNGTPGSLIGMTQVGTVSPGWNTLPLSVTIAPNTAYWLAYNTNGVTATDNNAATSALGYVGTQWMAEPGGNWPATVQSEGTARGYISVYFTYALGGTPPR